MKKILPLLYLFYLIFPLACIPYTEKQSCKSYGCSDTGLEILVTMCPAISNLQNKTCETFQPKFQTKEECLKDRDEQLNASILGCTLGIIHTRNLENKSDVPFSGGVCIFNC
ncbi:MAG: hypothetical protein KDK36_00365 [Leptospiraceae bacterium]|nr:hypothetical protein [Leptospiraceae bacterium]